MLEKEQMEENDIDFVDDEEYGYIASDLTKTLQLEGRTKMCSYYRDMNNDTIQPQLLPTYAEGDIIPTSEMTIQAYFDKGVGVFAEEIWGTRNDSKEYTKVVETLGLDTYYEDRAVDFSGPEMNGTVTKMLDDIGCSTEGMEYQEIDIQVNPLTVVYNTALSREENEELISRYFEVLSSLGRLFEGTVENFFSYHKRDLIECFGGKDQLLEFINTEFFLDDKSRSELEQDIRSYSPQEIVDGINVRQGELDAIIGETADISKGILDKENNDTPMYE